MQHLMTWVQQSEAGVQSQEGADHNVEQCGSRKLLGGVRVEDEEYT